MFSRYFIWKKSRKHAFCGYYISSRLIRENSCNSWLNKVLCRKKNAFVSYEGVYILVKKLSNQYFKIFNLYSNYCPPKMLGAVCGTPSSCFFSWTVPLIIKIRVGVASFVVNVTDFVKPPMRFVSYRTSISPVSPG
jgi:hypothetical protein